MTQTLSFRENFLISGSAAALAKTAAAPIERVKLLIQNQDEMLKTGRLRKAYAGALDCTLRTYRAEGLYPFWRGNWANVIWYFPNQALNFAFKDRLREVMFHDHHGHTHSFIGQFSTNTFSGAVAGALSLSFVYSLDYARTRLANDAIPGGKNCQRQFTGLIDVYRKTIQSDGVAGLYRGFFMSVIGIAVYRGFYFGVYDTLKSEFWDDHPSLFLSFLLGYGATIIAGLISYPFDTVRRRMMMTSCECAKYSSSSDCIRAIVVKEGYMSLMKGAYVNILRSLTGAAVLVGFDVFKDIYIKLRQFPED